MSVNTLRKTRDNLINIIPDKSAIVLFSGKKQENNSGNTYPFEVNRNFFYLTGINQEETFYVLAKYSQKIIEKLFIPINDEETARWVGNYISNKEAEEISGIENTDDRKNIYDFLDTLAGNDFVSKIFLEAKNINKNDDIPFVNLFKNDLSKRYPFIEIKSSNQLLFPLRKIKNDEEIENIKKAAEITNEAFLRGLKTAKTGKNEKDIETEIEYIFKKNKTDLSFNTIVASGKNGVILHYDKAEDVLKDGDLVLMDFGCAYNKYCADVSRTFPVNGKFTDRQKEIYNIVLAANKYIIENVKPGISLKELNDMLLLFYEEKLKEIGLIKKREDISKYYYHSVGHSLGLNVHDPMDRSIPLEEGMVVTVEPGLYIEEESIGIRIEDDVAVTKDGCEVLTESIIKYIKDIEEFMRQAR